MTHAPTHLAVPRPTRVVQRRARRGAQRGAATLIVVMLLFFLVSLVAAYAARNLIFEQKTSTNQYRATQAFEAAEAGLEWALAMLNGSRIDARCVPLTPPDVSQNSFRQRYLNFASDGNVTPRLWADNLTRERPSCVQSGGGWSCSCPSDGVPAPTLPGGGGVNPAFRVCFEAVPQPGVVRVVSTGRTAFIDESCDTPVEGLGGEAAASVSAVVALSSALPSPPVAAVTAGRNFGLTGGTTTLVNTDTQSAGLTTRVGATLSTIGGVFTRHSLPGTPGEGSSVVDPLLGAMTLSPPELFTSQMRMPLADYRAQPATVLVDCSADCANRLQRAVQGNPGRIVWVSGNVALSTSLNLGSDGEPAIVVVDGDISFTGGNVSIVGLLQSQRDISLVGGNFDVRGAVVAARDLTSVGTNIRIEYNPAHLSQPALIPPVLTQLRQSSGSLVRVPGSWRDFP